MRPAAGLCGGRAYADQAKLTSIFPTPTSLNHKLPGRNVFVRVNTQKERSTYFVNRLLRDLSFRVDERPSRPLLRRALPSWPLQSSEGVP